MERIRGDIASIAIGSLVAVLVATLVDGRELLRVRSIALAYGNDYRDALVIFVLVVTCTFAFATVILTVLSVVPGIDRKTLVVLAALPLSFFASLPVYWYVYHDEPPGWHINVAEEHRWAQPAGVAAALLAYGVSRMAISALRNGGRSHG